MASSKDIILRAGHGTPSTIVLRAPAVADAAAVTTIKLFPGNATASTIVLRDPSEGASAAANYAIAGAGTITISGAADLAHTSAFAIVGAGVITLSGAAALVYTAAAAPEPAPYVMPYTRNSDGPGYTEREPPRKEKEWPRVKLPARHYAIAGSGQIQISGAAAMAYTNNRPARDAQAAQAALQAANDARDALAIVQYLRRAA